MAHITNLGGVPRVSRVPIAVPNLSGGQRVSNAVMAGAGQAVTHAAISSLSPASATIEDITDQVGDADLMQQAAEFIASINAQAGGVGNGSVLSAAPQQGVKTTALPARVTSLVSDVATPCVGHARMEQLFLGLEQSQATVIDEIKESLAGKVSICKGTQ